MSARAQESLELDFSVGFNVLSHRGKPAARLEPVSARPAALSDDPFLGIGRRATASPKGKANHQDIDRIVYGRH
jgi:hypothetical protein